MKLAVWRKSRGLTQAELAELLGCTQSYVSQIERAVDALVPRRELMVKVYRLTAGAVQPNDFYDLPPLAERPLSEAA